MDLNSVPGWDASSLLLNQPEDDRSRARTELLRRRAETEAQIAAEVATSGYKKFKQRYNIDPDFKLGATLQFFQHLAGPLFATQSEQQQVSFGPSTAPRAKRDRDEIGQYARFTEKTDDTSLLCGAPQGAKLYVFDMEGVNNTCLFNAIAFCLNVICYRSDVTVLNQVTCNQHYTGPLLRKEAVSFLYRKAPDGSFVVADSDVLEIIKDVNSQKRARTVDQYLFDGNSPVSWMTRFRLAIEIAGADGAEDLLRALPASDLELLGTYYQNPEPHTVEVDILHIIEMMPNLLGTDSMIHLITKYMLPGLAVYLYIDGSQENIPNLKLQIQSVFNKDGEVSIREAAPQTLLTETYKAAIAILSTTRPNPHFKVLSFQDSDDDIPSIFTVSNGTTTDSRAFKYFLANTVRNPEDMCRAWSAVEGRPVVVEQHPRQKRARQQRQ